MWPDVKPDYQPMKSRDEFSRSVEYFYKALIVFCKNNKLSSSGVGYSTFFENVATWAVSKTTTSASDGKLKPWE